MELTKDSAFVMGTTHTVCEDYAFAGEQSGMVFALLADGCSGSPDTDTGARLLARSALKGLEKLADPCIAPPALEMWVGRAARAARRRAKALGLPPTSCDATLLGIGTNGRTFTAFACGDGLIVLGRADGALDVYAISYGKGYPSYPNYQTDKARQAEFLALENEKVVQVHRIEPSGVVREMPGTVLGSHGSTLLRGDCPDYRFAAVLSDGAQAFQRAGETGTAEAVAYLDVLPVLLGFKALNGTFVQRRLARFGKEARARGWQHYDDLSLAVVAFGE